MVAEGDIIIRYVITGLEGRNERDRFRRYIVPEGVTHVSVHESVDVIPAAMFFKHPSIVELICHVGVKRIESGAFCLCPRLRRIIIPGVEVLEGSAFGGCEAVTDIECDKLERIGEDAFSGCKSLRSINLPSVKVTEKAALALCHVLTEVTFGEKLETIGNEAFYGCPSLERITIPLKSGSINDDNIFVMCRNFRRIDLAGGAICETIEALALEEWRNDMNEEVDAINQMLPYAPAGGPYRDDEGIIIHFEPFSGKARTIRWWITSVLHKINHYEEKHRNLLNDAAAALQHALPNDIVRNYVLPFLELPPHEHV